MDIMDQLRKEIIEIPRDYEKIDYLLSAGQWSSKELAELSVIVTDECYGELTYPEHDPNEIDDTEVDMSQLQGPYLVDTLKLLLKHGLDPNVDFEEELAMDLCKYIGTPDIGAAALRLLLEHGGNPNIQLPDDSETLFESLAFDVGYEDFKLKYQLQCLMVLTSFGGSYPSGGNTFIMREGHTVQAFREFEKYYFIVEKVPTDKKSYPDARVRILDKTNDKEIAYSMIMHHD